MPLPLATMTLAPVVAFMMLALPRTPAAIVPALAAFPRPVPAPGAVDGRVGVWNRALDEAARQDRHGHHHQDPRREPAPEYQQHGLVPPLRTIRYVATAVVEIRTRGHQPRRDSGWRRIAALAAIAEPTVCSPIGASGRIVSAVLDCRPKPRTGGRRSLHTQVPIEHVGYPAYLCAPHLLLVGRSCTTAQGRERYQDQCQYQSCPHGGPFQPGRPGFL